MSSLLNDHGLPTLSARNTAMMTTISDVNATVVADLFGISQITAHAWARYAQASWIAYLAARAACCTAWTSALR
ncbi:hypothetical protein F3087_41580 [Nocardia colli]|uniref:Uncharacterized protein n=1 Tax=Nocardia colli TaxID=2545717 RepID=A0A5N0DWH5_9NOCA|nr:hypothetical protein [Nocardia colli]KAA8880365.1 hypothetical protein F3087_41580 [Nocardia colli]